MVRICRRRVCLFLTHAPTSTKILDALAILIDNKRGRSSAKSTARTLAAN
jgi:hypothetical protein